MQDTKETKMPSTEDCLTPSKENKLEFSDPRVQRLIDGVLANLTKATEEYNAQQAKKQQK